jgi:periplasmic divalent cation tolerance protein
MKEYIQVWTTVANQAEGERIAHELLARRLAACVQLVGPLASSYWWQGEIARAEEWLCIAKTERRLFESVAETIKRVHSYTVPEIIAIPIVAGSESYLRWLREQLQR